MDFRKERRELKQKLFLIRRFVEGENVVLDAEIMNLKKQYESNPKFTSWSGFPEKWDIGDPHSVKKNSWGNELDFKNFRAAFGKSYNDIIFKQVEE